LNLDRPVEAVPGSDDTPTVPDDLDESCIRRVLLGETPDSAAVSSPTRSAGLVRRHTAS
jgi:hypothetical protein